MFQLRSKGCKNTSPQPSKLILTNPIRSVQIQQSSTIAQCPMAHANPGMAMVADILRIVHVAHPDVANPLENNQVGVDPVTHANMQS